MRSVPSLVPPEAIQPNATQPDEDKAKAWLARIDDLIRQDKEREALDEWEKFRKAYPQYPVPEKFESQLKALKK